MAGWERREVPSNAAQLEAQGIFVPGLQHKINAHAPSNPRNVISQRDNPVLSALNWANTFKNSRTGKTTSPYARNILSGVDAATMSPTAKAGIDRLTGTPQPASANAINQPMAAAAPLTGYWHDLSTRMPDVSLGQQQPPALSSQPTHADLWMGNQTITPANQPFKNAVFSSDNSAFNSIYGGGFRTKATPDASQIAEHGADYTNAQRKLVAPDLLNWSKSYAGYS